MSSCDFSAVAVVAPSLSWRYSGVTSTIVALLPRQAVDVRSPRSAR